MIGLPLARGQVYKVPFDADDPARPLGSKIAKYIVILQNHQADFRWKLRTSFVLTTSKCDHATDPWNVFVPSGAFAGWPVDTVIQCADVYSYLVADVRAGVYQGLLSDAVMDEVSLALAVSLGFT